MRTVSEPRSAAVSTVVVAELGDLQAEWDRLVEWAPVPSPFLRSWWLNAASSPSRARYLLFLEDGALLGGLALQEQRSVLGVRVYRACTSGVLCPDHLDLLAAPGRELDVCRMFEQWLAGPGSRLLDLDGVVQHSLLAASLPPDATRVVAVAPWDVLPASASEYSEQLSSNLRRSQRRARNRLDALGIEHCRIEPADLSSALDDFAALHRERGDRSALLSELPRLRAALVAGFAAGEVQVDLLRSSERTVAVLICFRTAGALRAYQSARALDPELPDVGTALLSTVIEQACDEGCYEVDLLRGDEPYKLRFVRRQRDVCRVEVAHGLRARWMLAATRLVRRARAAVHTRMGRRQP